jgi:SAM-dependent methyltransferase
MLGGMATDPEFKDHFSGHAADYAAFRPRYPAELFQWAAALPAARSLAWDCATGNGQAAVALAGHFQRVVASDASAAQIAHAEPHPRVEYRVALAEAGEASGLAEGAVDLVTVAQALHWFDFDRFYAEVRRVLAPGGAIAVWSYDLVRVTPEIDRLIDSLARDVVGAFWPPERRWVDERYRTLPFPFAEIAAPPFQLEESWDLPRLLAYLRTWSSATRFRAATGRDAVAEATPELAGAWGDPGQERAVRWPLSVRAGRPAPERRSKKP